MIKKLPGYQRSLVLALAALLFGGGVTPGFAGNMSLPGSFAVSSTGAATYTIPIAVPPGTAGMMPALSIEYSSQSANGLLGLGWSLSGLPSIVRCPRTTAQDGAVGGVNFDANDRFCMEGQRLVAVSGTYGADGTQYRTEVETFSKIISHGTAGNGPAWFEVHTKSGQTMEFGNTADSRILAQGRTSARIWTVNKVSDTKSNYFAVTYVNDTANGQYYPSRIDYTGNSAASLSPYNSVQFVYATRPDVYSRYQAGSLMQTTVRLTDVKTFTGTALVADYKLAYQQSGAANRSRLTSVTACDGGGGCLPATSLAWTAPSAGFPSAPLWNSCYGTDCGWSDNSVNPRMLVDVNGDGLPDIVGFADGGVTVSLNTGSSFASGQMWSAAFVRGSGWSNNDTYPRMLVDVNGDGLPDVVGFATGGAYVALNTGTSFSAAKVWNTGYGNDTGWTSNSRNPRMLADVNGDGLPDIVGFSDGGVDVSLNTGSSFASGQVWNTCYGSACGWSDNNVNPRMLVDVNGDGLPDIVGFADSGVTVSLNTGSSFASGQVWNAAFVRGSGWSNNDTYPRMLVDVNGDGLPDVVGFATGGVYVALDTGTSFSAAKVWNTGYGNDTGWTSNSRNPRMLVDVNGDGLPDIVGFADGGVTVSLNSGSSFGAGQLWYGGFGAGSGWNNDNIYPRFVLDVLGTGFAGVVGFAGAGVQVATNTASVLPDLLSSVTTGLGATTTISYVPATKTSVVTKGTGTVFPTLDLIAPIYVASRLDTSNGAGGSYSSTYGYSGARIDMRGRGFLGFAQTSVKDLQTNITDTTTYRQDFPYIGMVASTKRTVNSQTLGQSTNTYQFANASGGTTIAPANAPYRVTLSQNVSSGADLDGSALPTVTTANQYDAYNNATQVVVSTPDGFSKTTTNTYSNDATNWYLGRLTRASVANVAP